MDNIVNVWVGLIDGRTIEFKLTQDEYFNLNKRYNSYLTSRADGISNFYTPYDVIDLSNVIYISLAFDIRDNGEDYDSEGIQ